MHSNALYYITYYDIIVSCVRYTVADFTLSPGLKIDNVHTSIDKGDLSTNKDVENLLITHWEIKTIHHDTETPIHYKRLTHVNFKYHLEIENPTNVERKVFIRLWLGYLKDEKDMRFVVFQYIL